MSGILQPIQGKAGSLGGYAFVSGHSEIRLGDFFKGGLDSKGAK